MTVIYKYGIGPNYGFEIPMPRGAKVLTAGMQQGNYYIWALVDPTRDMCKHEFMIYGTGWDNVEGEFVGTVFDGSFVWHVFDLGEKGMV